MSKRLWMLLCAMPVLAQGDPLFRIPDHGWGMAVGSGFSEVPLLVDVHYTFKPGIGFYLGGGGTPHAQNNDFSFNLNFNDRGTLRQVKSAGYIGVAVTRHPRVAWGVGFGKHTTSWEIDHGGGFTAEEMARLDSSRSQQGAHGWVAYYPGRVFGIQAQAGPGWGGLALAMRFR